MRVFAHDGYTHAMSMPGQFYRSRDPLGGFEAGPLLFNRNMRHAGLLKRGPTLFVFWTQVGDVPDRIFLSLIDLSGDWMLWSETDPVEMLRPAYNWEGADAPLEPSVRSTAYGHMNQLRDPAIFEDAWRVFLLYAVAGESGYSDRRDTRRGVAGQRSAGRLHNTCCRTCSASCSSCDSNARASADASLVPQDEHRPCMVGALGTQWNQPDTKHDALQSARVECLLTVANYPIFSDTRHVAILGLSERRLSRRWSFNGSDESKMSRSVPQASL